MYWKSPFTFSAVSGYVCRQIAEDRSLMPFRITLICEHPVRSAPSVNSIVAPKLFGSGVTVNVTTGLLESQDCADEEGRLAFGPPEGIIV